jgi:hypothetical protein
MDSSTAALILPTVIGFVVQVAAYLAILCLEYATAAHPPH